MGKFYCFLWVLKCKTCIELLINAKFLYIHKGSRKTVPFISTRDTTPPAGQGRFKQLVRTEVRGCATPCVSNLEMVCFGFSFNPATNSCIHYYDFDYDLGPVGGSPGVDHYRRIFQSGKYNNPHYYWCVRYKNLNESYCKYT